MNRCPYTDLEPGRTPSGFDVVELKYDGCWARAEIAGGECVIYSRTGQVKACQCVDPRLGRLTLIGEYMRGTQWSRETGRTGRLYAFDVVADGTLAERRQALEQAFDHLPMPPWMRLVKQYPASQWRELWARRVALGQFEGLVFKRSDGLYGEPWGRMKARVTAEFICLGVNRGTGRLADSAGSIRGGLYANGELVHILDIGGGLTDRERRSLWADPARYIGRVCEVVGNARFVSGALRHPRFERWRNDKAPRECVAA